MTVKYNTEQLNRITEDIFVLTGISVKILDAEHKTVAASKQTQEYCSLLHSVENEKSLCAACDKVLLKRCFASKALEYHVCRAGLYDCAMPIMKYGTLAGFVIMGQIRSDLSPALPPYLPKAGAQVLTRLTRAYEKLPFIPQNRLRALYDLLPRILFENAIMLVHDPFVSNAVAFIDANLQGRLSVTALCKEFHVSKNYLYEAFKDNLGKTVTEYINEQRMRVAKELLESSREPVYKIAEKVGVDNYTYFCKLFKKLTGVTPTEYRKKGNITP